MDKLHDNVYFDENDFEDDADVNLDEEVAQPQLDVQYPTLPLPTSKSQSTLLAASSQPLPWSSSPLQHKLPSKSQLSPAAEPQPIYPVLPAESNSSESKPIKRRTIPWLNENGEDEDNPSISLHVKETIKRKKTARSTRQMHDASKSFTPLPKDTTDTPYPWNKTASAMKEEQKRLRQNNKRVTKSEAKFGPDAHLTPLSGGLPAISRIHLSEEQRQILDMVTNRRQSVFFTGSAGTGKSVLMREIIKTLKATYKRETDRVAITASTGLAACNVGGVTLHSFAGIGLGKEAVPELVKKIKRNQKAKNRWLRTKILIIDEISMVDGDLFDKLEAIARTIRNNGRPFGGIQLVITGDFFQLPPVPEWNKAAKFCFDAATWNTSIEHTIGLTQVFRQRDPGILAILRFVEIFR